MKYFEIPLINLRTRCCESAASETVYVKACEERWRSVYSVTLVIAMRSALDAEWPVAPHVLHSRYGHVRRASFLAMPGLRAQRTVMRALFLVGSMRFRSTVSTNHRVYSDPMMIRFRSLTFLCSGIAWTSAARPRYLLTQRPCSDLRCQALYLPTTLYLRCSPAMMNRSWRRRPEADFEVAKCGDL